MGRARISCHFLRRAGRAFTVLSLFAFLVSQAFVPAVAQVVNVLTQHNDNARTGANLKEARLTTANVRVGQFGKLFTRKVDGQVYAQPLYVSNLDIRGSIRRNVVYVATQHGSVYAFDADDPNRSTPYWKVSLINPAAGITTVPWYEVSWAADINNEICISGTPVIDRSTNTLYVVAKTKEEVGPAVRYAHHLHALDIRTGREKFGAPVKIAAVLPGTGDSADGQGSVIFDDARQHQRPALLLLNGVVYAAFASHGDTRPYHGWVLGYDARALQQVTAYNTTPNGGLGGIWQAGQGPAADAAGNIYLMTGNGSFTANNGGAEYGDSFVKLGTSGGLNVLDYFTPFNETDLQNWDADLGSAGPMLIPDTNLVVGGGKEGRLYLLDRSNLGKYNAAGDTQIVQWFWAYNGHLHGSPIYWNGPNGPLIYLWSENDYLKAFKLEGGLLQTTPFATSTMPVSGGMPGAFLSLSANSGKPGTGIIWASHPYEGNANWDTVPGILRAFDASTLEELWNSKMVAERDDVGMFAKYSPPTIANGKVYLATFSNELAVYGLGKWAAMPAITPNGGEFTEPISVTLASATPGATLRYTTNGSEPTSASPRYTRPFTVSDCGLVRARAFVGGSLPSPVAQAYFHVGDPPGNGDGLLASYFPNLDLAGAPIERVDSTVNFWWGGGSPIGGIGGENWSARWTGQVVPRCSGEYTFTTVSDDGVRLWVDGQLLIDNWTYHGATANSGKITLTAGRRYDIKAEFFQGPGDAVMQLFWSHEGQPNEIIPQSQLYSGQVAMPVIAPDAGAYYPSVAVTLSCITSGAEIRYTTNGSDPTASSPLYTGPFTLTGTTTVKAKAFKVGLSNSSIASADFFVNPSLGRGNGLRGFYFNNITLSGPPATRIDSTVDFEWGGGSPIGGVGGENWSARWFGQVQPLYSEEYTFSTVSDDGVRLWVNDQLVIDNWTYHGPTEDSGKITLVAGRRYDIKMEFFQGAGWSVARLLWSSARQRKQVIPKGLLYSF